MGVIAAFFVLALLAAKAAGGSGSAKPPPKDTSKPLDTGGSGGGDGGGSATATDPGGGTKVSLPGGGSVVVPPIKVDNPFAAIDTSKVSSKEVPLSSLGPDGSLASAKMPPIAATWPGIQSLPPQYRNPAMDAVQNLRYQWVMEDEGPTANYDPCLKGTCSSEAVYAAFEPIHKDQGHIEAVYGGLGGADPTKAMNELSHAYNKLKAVGR